MPTNSGVWVFIVTALIIGGGSALLLWIVSYMDNR